MGDTVVKAAEVAGAERVVKVGLARYKLPNGNTWHAQMGETIRVHPDDVERFDKWNKPIRVRDLRDEMRDIVDVREPTAAERRIIEGFGERPITEDALRIELMEAERRAEEDEAAQAAEFEDRVQAEFEDRVQAEVDARVEAEMARRMAQTATAQDAPETGAAAAAPARNRRG